MSIPAWPPLKAVPQQLRSRMASLQLLSSVVLQAQSLQQQQDLVLKQLPEQDRAFAMQLLLGSLRCYEPLRALVRQFLRQSLKAKQRWLEPLLVLGAYQLLAMNLASRAVVHSMAELPKLLQQPHLTGLVNGVLRAMTRANLDIERLYQHDTSQDQANSKAGAEHWLLEQIRQDWPEQASSIISAQRRQSPMMLRVNSQQIDRELYLRHLSAQQIEVDSALQSTLPMCRDLIELVQSQPVQHLPGFESGQVSVQDASAQLAVELLLSELSSQPSNTMSHTHQASSPPTLRLLDACAAPGGKTAHLLERLGNRVQLCALDSEATRLKRLRQNLTRLQLDSEHVSITAQTLQAYAMQHTASAQARFDAVLLDAPCSGTGVISRHPDIVWCRRQSDIDTLAQLQRELLAHAASLVKPGGLLLYATCSILKQENSLNIEQFLQTTSYAIEAVSIAASWGEAQSYGRQRLPGIHPGDGFYYALMRIQS